MIAAIIVVSLLAIIAGQARATGAAVLLGVVVVLLIGAEAPAFVSGVGHVIAVVAQGISDGVSRAAG